ncbi:phosphoribosylglycinamide formyltransferase [Polyangium jinanense]|uniref:Phosphoribosylglycinamide formyltransferase n=1 Tax=Polyangium jinanense TaxID=2829994 RepID=A0A9X3X102_9BACT|nr:phosphoribosylglycinamide formyltransferase [Polyangium jinanense]MDC3952719.1 phosphoribosylglycinamide formyltransferase [Polyangium jinanense]MDC3980338.1 phosphoribosylglycinamide formyltransferase [Polyangium jinanense]
MTLDLGVLISGRGSNLQAILDAIAAGKLDARVRLVISNRPSAQGLDRAREAGVPTVVISHKDHPDRASFDAALVAALQQAGASWVVLAGFMRIVTSVLLDAFPGRVINIHPSLLPAFPGVSAQAQALAHGVRITGCTVHLVDVGTDTGPILAQAAVPVLPDDTEERLSTRILAREHALLVHVLAAIAAGHLTVHPPATAAARPRVELVGVPGALGVEATDD